jgi:hypothetical protein
MKISEPVGIYKIPLASTNLALTISYDTPTLQGKNAGNMLAKFKAAADTVLIVSRQPLEASTWLWDCSNCT